MSVPEAAADAEEVQYVDRYLSATRAQQGKASTMRVEIEASLPSLGKQGKAFADRQVSKDGLITYGNFQFDADATIKNEVIARYIQAEKEGSEKPEAVAITPENYRFKYRGTHGEGDWRLYLLEVIPKQKKPGLFRGWLWVESKSNLAVREQGEIVRSPSIFLRKITFTKDYEIRGDTRAPTVTLGHTETRIVGDAEMTIRYFDVRVAESR